MRKVKLDLPVNANKNAVRAKIRTAGLKEYGSMTGKLKDADWDKDLDDMISRSTPHNINTKGVIQSVSVKINTLEVMVDDNNEIIGWTYEES